MNGNLCLCADAKCLPKLLYVALQALMSEESDISSLSSSPCGISGGDSGVIDALLLLTCFSNVVLGIRGDKFSTVGLSGT